MPACEELVDVELQLGAYGAREWVVIVLRAEVPAGRPFVVEANALVAVSCEQLAQCVAIGKDEVFVDVSNH